MSIAYSPKFSRIAAENETPDCLARIRVSRGSIIAHVDVEKYELEFPKALYIPILNAANSLVEVAGLRIGVPYEVVFDEVVHPSGKVDKFIFADRSLGRLISSYKENEIEAISDVVISNAPLAKAISDTLLMLKRPDYAPIACGRVADAIVNMISGGRRSADWEKMRAALRVDEAFVRLLTETSIPARHGKPVYVSGQVTGEISKRAWILLDRYIVYLRSGEKHLGNDYPMLLG